MVKTRWCCGCSPSSHRLQWRRRHGPSPQVAVAPRSPLGYNHHNMSYETAMRCGCSPSSHRLQSPRKGGTRHGVAVAPRSPIGYNAPSANLSSVSCGCSPISHRLQSIATTPLERMSCGCSPISHRLQLRLRHGPLVLVAVAPRSPIGYNMRDVEGNWSVLRLLPDLPSATMHLSSACDMFPLRLLPDLPSATMKTCASRPTQRCGCSPISHRLQ